MNDEFENIAEKLKEMMCPECESAEVGFFFPAELFNCNDCKHEWRELNERNNQHHR
jgi:uncharacterized Zn ribbon protein